MGDTDSKVSLKLLVDTKANKVLFAEGSKDFVDFLFHILSLPVGTAIELVSTKGMVGCLGDLYSSVETLSSDYLQPGFNVNSLLKPSSNASDVRNFLLLKDTPPETAKMFYGCAYGHTSHVSDSTNAVCPSCNHHMNSQKTFIPSNVTSSSKSAGYVKGVVTYMIMDNLEVKPMSTISGITLINKFNVKDVASLAEKHVQFGIDQGIALLKASFETRAVLTAVFLSNKV